MQTTSPSTTLTATGKWVVLVVALLGWMGSGVHMAITQLVGQAAAIDLLGRSGEIDAARFQQLNKQLGPDRRGTPTHDSLATALSPDQVQLKAWREHIAQWFAWFTCSFLFGAATGGLLFGWVGDRFGRAKGMAASILTYSAMAGAAYFATSPELLLVCWFTACLGVGGMWPNGVALISEAWSGMSRAMVSGVMGTSANIGLFWMNSLATNKSLAVTSDNWRWTMLVGAAPLVLGIFSWLFVPESPRWLAIRRGEGPKTGSPMGPATPPASFLEIFRGQLLWPTLIGIAIATVPMMGGWGTAAWMQPWAGEAGDAASPPDPALKARVGQSRALTGMIGSLIGGWVATIVGRKLTFFLTSLGAFTVAQFTFWFLVPTDPWFLTLVGALGFFSGIYYGWMPLCLPELFPTRSRSTGAGVSFNFGRIITAITVFATGALMQFFEGDYARIGRMTSVVFALGMVVICFAPDTSKKQLSD